MTWRTVFPGPACPNSETHNNKTSWGKSYPTFQPQYNPWLEKVKSSNTSVISLKESTPLSHSRINSLHRHL